MQIQAKPQARVAGGIYAFSAKHIARRTRPHVCAEALRIPLDKRGVQPSDRDNQPGATLGAKDDVRKKMTEGPTHT